MADLKSEWPSRYEWLLNLPGGWHTLLAFQQVLKKLFYHAGLLKLASKMGFSESAEKGLFDIKNFKRNHNFLLQAFEGRTRAFPWWHQTERSQNRTEHADLEGKHHEQTEFRKMLAGLKGEYVEEDATYKRLQVLYAAVGLEETEIGADFWKWGDERVEKSGDKTLRFWWQFIRHDIFAYLCLYFAIRSGDWDLNVAAFKLMGPYFRVCDRTHFEKLVPLHLAQLKEWPE